ncbi:MAG: hypothetical protein F4Z86_19165, partial [Gemmatimonadetes bacterium]|nr:hypothetical protein [Gemmatimonadota bacterium]
MKRARFLRRLPAWHREEKNYRDWYIDLVDNFDFNNTERYDTYVKALHLPDDVRGYREVIWPKMTAAKKMANYWLNGKGTPPKLDRRVLD